MQLPLTRGSRPPVGGGCAGVGQAATTSSTPERARAPWGPKEGAQREKTGTIFIDGFPLIFIDGYPSMNIQFFEIQFFETQFFETQFFEIQFFEKTMKNNEKPWKS